MKVPKRTMIMFHGWKRTLHRFPGPLRSRPDEGMVPTIS